MISMKLNQNDIERILGKLNRTLAASAEHKFEWRLKLLNEYKETVSTAMGTVSARGGYPRIHFDSATGINYWNALRPSTIRKKLENRGTKASTKNPGDLYKEYASSLTIWYDTGETKQSVGVFDNFAGIISQSALQKAHVVEDGDPKRNIKARPLFVVANHLIINTIHTMLQNDQSWLAAQMRREFVALAKGNGWGS